VIELLNAHFVPVYTSNEDYGERGSAPAEEKKALRRIYEEALAKKLSTGTVHVYVLTPMGEVIDSRHVAKACEKGEVERLLESVTAKLKTPAGQPIVKPRPQSRPKDAGADSLVLHVTARGRGCSWDEFPSESWIVLETSEQAKLLPAAGTAPGASWTIDRSIAEKLFTHFYPQTENNDASPKRIESISLSARLLEPASPAAPGVQRARLEGRVRLKHAFYPGRDDGRVVDATAVGYMDLEPARAGGGGKVRKLRLATQKATYGPGTIDVAVRETRTD